MPSFPFSLEWMEFATPLSPPCTVFVLTPVLVIVPVAAAACIYTPSVNSLPFLISKGSPANRKWELASLRTACIQFHWVPRHSLSEQLTRTLQCLFISITNVWMPEDHLKTFDICLKITEGLLEDCHSLT